MSEIMGQAGVFYPQIMPKWHLGGQLAGTDFFNTPVRCDVAGVQCTRCPLDSLRCCVCLCVALIGPCGCVWLCLTRPFLAQMSGMGMPSRLPQPPGMMAGMPPAAPAGGAPPAAPAGAPPAAPGSGMPGMPNMPPPPPPPADATLVPPPPSEEPAAKRPRLETPAPPAPLQMPGAQVCCCWRQNGP